MHYQLNDIEGTLIGGFCMCVCAVRDLPTELTSSTPQKNSTKNAAEHESVANAIVQTIELISKHHR